MRFVPAARGRMLAVVMAVAALAGCGGGSSSTPITITPTPTPVANSVSVAVDAGPANSAINSAYVTVKVCNTGGTTNCATIPDVQVDTGSSGLRILASAPGVSTLTLKPVSANGTPVYECLEYASGNYLWGPVEQAGVAMAGESAPNVPIQIITSGDAPSSVNCASSGGSNLDTSTALEANGILGIGPAQQDCGLLCTASPVAPYYWLCSSSTSCSSPAAVPTATQVSNPVIFFGSDNNGVTLTMNALGTSGGAASGSGTLYCGVGTQTDNAVAGSAKAYGLSANVFGGHEYISAQAVYNNVTYPAYVNSAENILFVLDAATLAAAPAGAGITGCPTTIFYCPSSPVNLPINFEDASGDAAQINLSIGNGTDLYNSSVAVAGGANAAFNNLAGGAALTTDEVILGMPFFYGRTVYIGIAGEVPPSGVPGSFADFGYWAF
jgi:hypothetical protein